MKVVSDFFRLWLSLRPAQRVWGVTSCFWVGLCVIGVILELRELGTLSMGTFTRIALVHGALASRTSMALYLYPGLVPRLPDAARKGLIQSAVEMAFVAVLLACLSSWARSLGIDSSRPIADFGELLMHSGIGWLGVYVILRRDCSAWVKVIVVYVGAAVGVIELVYTESAILITLLMVVVPIGANPPAPSKSKQQDCSSSEVSTSGKSLWQKWSEIQNRSLALFPEGAWVWQTFFARTGNNFLAGIAGLAGGTVLSGEVGRQVYFVIAILLLPMLQSPLPREVVFPGLMGASRSQWARRHVFFRARLWCAWGLGILFAIILLESIGPLIDSDPQHGRSSMEPLIAWSFLTLLVFGLFRMIRYIILDPFHLQLSGKSVGIHSNLLRSLGWPYGNLSAVVLGLVAIVAVMIAIIWGKLVVVGIIGFLSGNYWSEPLLSLVLSGVLLLLAIAAWALSFRLQYSAILERDLV